MTYNPTTWQNGDTITATALNAMESGIGENNMSYEATTWQTGDTITAELLNKMEQGIAEGGGGSSDLKAATVEFIGSGFEITQAAYYFGTDDEYTTVDAVDEEGTYIFPFYKSISYYINIESGYTITTTGDVSYDRREGVITITGDGTVTVATE